MKCISRSTVCKLLFCSEFTDILEKFSRRKTKLAIPKRFALQANAKIVKYFMFYTMFNRTTFQKKVQVWLLTEVFLILFFRRKTSGL